MKSLFPSLAKEGCREAVRWFVHQPIVGALNQRPRLREAFVASRNFLDRAATPPYPRRGIRVLINRSKVEQHTTRLRDFLRVKSSRAISGHSKSKARQRRSTRSVHRGWDAGPGLHRRRRISSEHGGSPPTCERIPSMG